MLCFTVIAVDAVLQVNSRDATQNDETRIVRDLRRQISRASREELVQVIQLAEQQIELLDVGLGSVRIYFCCRSAESLDCLLGMLDTGQLQTAVDNLISSLYTDGNVSVKFLWIRSGINSCTNYNFFSTVSSKFFSFIHSVYSVLQAFLFI